MDVFHTCRLCLFKSDDLCDMNTTMSESICFLEAMHYTFGQECILDDQPKLVCKQCAIDIEFTYSFRQKCEKSFEALAEFLVKQENKYSDGETDEFEIQPEWGKMGEQQKYTIELYSDTGYECKTNGIKQKVLEFDEFADDEEVVIKTEIKEEWEEKNYCELSNLDTGSMNFYNDESSEVKFTSFTEVDEGSFESNEGTDSQMNVSVLSTDEGDEMSPENKTLLHIRPFKCDTCGKTFLRKWNWKQHQMIHNHNKPHICTTCGKSFTTRCVLRDHEARHTNDRPFVCEVCDKRFGTRQVLKRHMMTHSTEKRYTCETCGKAFSQRCSLQYHEVTHSGVRPHACDKCDKKFMRRWNLRQHLLTHAPNWGSSGDVDGSASNKVTSSEQPTIVLLKS